MSIDYGLIGRRIHELRKEKKWTQERLAESLSVSVGYISQIERGVTKVSLDTLSEISVALDCEITSLISHATPRQPAYLTEELQELMNSFSDRQKKLLYGIAEQIRQCGE